MKNSFINLFLVLLLVLAGCASAGKPVKMVKVETGSPISLRDNDYFDKAIDYMPITFYPSGKSSFTLMEDEPVEIVCSEKDGRVEITMDNVDKYFLLKVVYPGISTISINGVLLEKFDSPGLLRSSPLGWGVDRSGKIIMIKAFLSGQPIIVLE